MRSPSRPKPSFAVEPVFRTVQCISRSGLHNVAYTEWGKPDAARVALCAHGLTRQGRDFDALAVALVQRGYRVICPDLAGRGRSDWLRDPEDYQLTQYVSDVVTLLARIGVEQVDWIGTSLGGLMGIHLAALAHAPIRRMVINDVGPFLPWQALDRIATYVRKMPKSLANWHAAEAYFREVHAPYGNLGDAEWLHLTKHSLSRDQDGRYRLLVDPDISRAMRTVMFFNVSMWPQWDMMRCPVLALRGQYSDLLSRQTAEEMTRRGPPTRLVEFPDCGHAPALMDFRQVGTVVKWLMQADVSKP
jgi:pimeloyl-ACP methyl ester carboxylesterase